MSSYSGGQYGGGDYGDGNSGEGAYGSFTPSSNVVEGTAVAVPVASSVTADSNTYASPSMAQHPSTMPDSKMKV